MSTRNESRLSALSARDDAIGRLLPEPSPLLALVEFMLIAEVCVLGDPDAALPTIKAALARQAAGIDPALLRSIERQERGRYPYDKNLYSSDDTERLQARIRLAAFLRDAVAQHF